jgi:4-oxalocrotonate tautomerase
MPLVEVTLIEGRSPADVKRLAAALTAAMVETLGAPPETIRVLVHELPATHWLVGGQSLAERAAKKDRPS